MGLRPCLLSVLFVAGCASAPIKPSPPTVSAPPPSPAATLENPHNPADLFADAQSACADGEAKACHVLASRLLEGASAPEARAYRAPFEAGCEKHVPDACAGLAQTGALPPADALATLERACSEGSSVACAQVAERTLHDETPADRQSAALVSATAQCEKLGGSVCFSVAALYASANGDKANEAKVLAWVERGCETGSGYACHVLGMTAAEAKDVARAKGLYERACGASVGPACFNLAWLLLDGTPAPADVDRGRTLARRACQLGDPSACDYLYATDDGQRRNLAEGESPYPGDAEKQRAASHWCAEGGAEPCTDLAFARGAIAEQSGNLAEMESVLGLLQRGCGRDSVRACNVLHHVAKDAIAACEAGNGGQCLVAGFVHTQGVSVPSLNGASRKPDPVAAKAAFEKACASGVEAGCARAR